MTLRKQLFIVIIVLFTLIFIGTFIISVRNFESYLITTLESQAQNTASSLGFTLTQENNQEKETMRSLINPIFATGNYEAIVVKDLEGKTYVERRSEINNTHVPEWFVDMIPLEIAPGEGLISAGWSQFGTIYIFSDINEAYAELWNHVIQTFTWFFGSAVITLILGLLALRVLLRPLDAVRKQAEGICNRDFSIQNKVPRTKELAAVVKTMNKVSDKVHQMFEKQTKLTEQLREQAYEDSQTSLGNRRFFNMKLEYFLNSPEEFYRGTLFLVELKNIDKYKKAQGFEACDLYVNRIGGTLKDAATKGNNFIACRLCDADFALLAPNLSHEEAEELVTNLCDKLSDLHAKIDDADINFHIGVAIYRHGQTASDLLSEADMALRTAENKGNNSWHMYDVGELQKTLIHSAAEWKDFLDKVIAEQNIVLHYQPIMSLGEGKSETIQHEVLLRLADEDGKLLNAGVFIPMAENLNKMPELDRIVILKLIEELKANPGVGHRFAVNLSPASITDESFIEWLKNTLSKNQDIANSFIFELPEHTAIHELDLLHDIIEKLAKIGCEFSLDHFGRGFTSFHYLRDLKVSYIKIDGSYIRNINEDTGNQFFLHVVTGIAQNLDIKVIAENVEHQEEVTALRTLQVDGIQGYLTGKPSGTPEDGVL